MSKKLVYLILLLVISASVLAQGYRGKIGVGVSMGHSLPFVDAAKTLRRFEAIGGGAAPTDSNGWPTADARTVLFDHRPVAAWEGDIDDPDQYQIDVTGTYKMSFMGQATLSNQGTNCTFQNMVYDPVTNTTTANLVVTGPFVVVQFTNTRRTPTSGLNTGITNLKAIRPGYSADTTQTFHTPFIETLTYQPFSAIRFLGFSGVNNAEPTYPAVTEWSDRKLLTDATQNRWGSKKDGAAWEYVIELANEAGMDPWVSVPVSATMDYITQLATMLRDNLSPNLNIYVESSNEVWNTAPGFNQSAYNEAQAAALGLTKQQNHARRAKEIIDIFSTVFGSGRINDRIRYVLCWFIGAVSQYGDMLNWLNTNYGQPNQYIYAVGEAPYFNCGGVCSTGTPEEILTAMWASSDNSVVPRIGLQAVADSWGLKHFCYEGGSDTGGGSTVNVANRIRAERHAGMKDVMIHDLADNWFPLGGELFMYLSLCSGYNRYGSWGMTDDITNPNRNYKFEAVRQLLLEGDFDGNGVIDEDDLRIFVGQWLYGTLWPGENLISYWNFDENSGTDANDSAGNNDGIINGAQWTSGKFSRALKFVEAGDYVDCGNDSSLDLTNNFSISIWVNLNQQFGFILNKGNVRGLSSGGAYTLYYTSVMPGAVTFEVRNSSNNGSQWVTISPFETEKWTHIVGTFSDGQVSIYKNGSFVESKSLSTTTIRTNTGHLGIGANGSGSLSINGKIDDVRIYNRALSPAEVEQLYNNACSGTGCADFDGIDGVNFVDFAILGENWKK